MASEPPAKFFECDITFCYRMTLTAKQERLLVTIFADPAAVNPGFGEIQRLLTALGAERKRSQTGQTAFFMPGGMIWSVCCLNAKEAIRNYQLMSLREALIRSGLAER